MTEQQNEEDLNELEEIDDHELPEEQDHPKIPSQKKRSKAAQKQEDMRLKPISLDEPNVMRQKARSLSYEQRIAFDKVIHYAKCVFIDRKGIQINAIPPILILHGK